jgi:hypothetical protein
MTLAVRPRFDHITGNHFYGSLTGLVFKNVE